MQAYCTILWPIPIKKKLSIDSFCVYDFLVLPKVENSLYLSPTHQEFYSHSYKYCIDL